METRMIALSKGKFAVVDGDDYERASQFKWTYTDPGYAYRNDYSNGQRKRIYLHRFILCVKDKTQVVDHINGNKLDNTKSNLRVCSHQENIRNSRKQLNNTSGYKGVSWDKNRGKWISYFSPRKKFNHLGRFNCKHAAARAYNLATSTYYGEFANINEVERCDCAECAKYQR